MMPSASNDKAEVSRANEFYYHAMSSLDLALVEKAWAHNDYVTLVGPRHTAPMIGWSDIRAYYAKAVSTIGKISLRPIDPHINVNGDYAWIVAREEIGADSRLKDGSPLSTRPTISTNVFEKIGGKWLMVSHHAQEIHGA